MEVIKNGESMKYGLIFSGFILMSSGLLTSCGANKDMVGPSEFTESSIVNGKTVTRKNEVSRSIVAIVADKNEGQALCTGTLISSDVVLTAAHCVEDNPSKLHIVFGLNVGKTKEKDIRSADKFIQHSNWGRHMPSGEADLALIHFSGGLVEGFVPVKLATKGLKLTSGEEVLMAGFGVTDGGAETGAGKLRQTISTILEEHSVTEFVTDGKKSSVCFGDSGGPAFVKTKNELVQWGVASSVTNRACDEASIHTAVMGYLPWIKVNMVKLRR